MASLHEILTMGRVSRDDKPAPRPYPVVGRRRPRGAFMPVSVCVGVTVLAALVIALGVALRA